MIVRYRERALLDIDELHKYIEEQSPSGARNVLREIYRSIALIVEQPLPANAQTIPMFASKSSDDIDIRFSTPCPTKERSRSVTCATPPGSL